MIHIIVTIGLEDNYLRCALCTRLGKKIPDGIMTPLRRHQIRHFLGGYGSDFFVKVNFEILIGVGRYGQGLYLGVVPESARPF